MYLPCYSPEHVPLRCVISIGKNERQKAKKSERPYYTVLPKTNPNQSQSGLCQVPNRGTLTVKKLTKESSLLVFASKQNLILTLQWVSVTQQAAPPSSNKHTFSLAQLWNNLFLIFCLGRVGPELGQDVDRNERQ